MICVPRMGFNEGCFDNHHLWLAQWIEHQTMNLAVAGSTPVPPASVKNSLRARKRPPPRPEGVGRPFGRLPVGCVHPTMRNLGWLNLRVGRRVNLLLRCTAGWQQHVPVPCSAQIPPVIVLRGRSWTTVCRTGSKCSRAVNRLNRSNTKNNAGSSALRNGKCDRRIAPSPEGFYLQLQ